MRDRPLYVGFVCWALIFYGSWLLVHSFSVLNSPAMQKKMAAVPLPMPVQVAQYFVGLVVPVATAAFMTEGANWARVLYITWGILNYLLAAIYVPDKTELLPGLPIFAASAALLMLPAARAYFLLPRHHS
jgi:hypothetical protein